MTTSHRVRIDAPRNKVFEAITTANGLRGWYTPGIEGDVLINGEATFTFDGKEPFRWKFVELTPMSAVRWECLDGPGSSKGTTVSFEIDELADGRVQVLCEHAGWPESDMELAACNTLWGMLMASLRNYAETSEPAPAFA
jgi:uncharacterized protein YndB with AHSA1/START domain